jgi:predicted nucleic acid-binding protein
MPCFSQDKAIISDTSCLIALTDINKLDILKRLYSEIFVTPEIAAEYIKKLPDWIKLKEVQDKQKVLQLKNEKLGSGESSAIALALEIQNSMLILDDDKARKYALKNGLTITGTLGVVSAAYDLGYIDNYDSVCADLNKVNFHFSKRVQSAVRNNISKNNGISF